MNNTHILCFVLGWQGGAVHQVAAALDVKVNDILQANDIEMGDLCRKAQAIRWKDCQTGQMLLLKHLNSCITALKRDYEGHDIPSWLERAIGVAKIFSEQLPTSDTVKS